MEEPSAKRPRLAQPAAANQDDMGAPAVLRGPSIISLFQTSAGLPRDPSPGAMHGCRIAAYATPGTSLTYASALASGASVYWSHVALQQHAVPDQGKEGVLLPVRSPAPSAVQLQELRHAGEVQSLALIPGADQQQLLLATADSFGQGIISRLNLSDSLPMAAADEMLIAGAGAAAGVPAVVCQALLRPSGPCCEGGWAGVCFSGSSSSSSSGVNLQLAVARGFAKDISIFDAATGSVARMFNCALNPYALQFLPANSSSSSSSDSNILAVAEGHMISIWDIRASGSGGGCMQRVAASTAGSPLYTVEWCSAQGGLLGAAGAERSVYMTDMRKLRVVAKWTGATRQAIHSLSFLHCDPRYAVLSGLDMEVLCGRWDKPGSNARAFPSMAPGEDEQATAAPGAPGSGDRSRRQAAAAAAAVAPAKGVPGAAAGNETEVAGGFSFRGDSRWLGMSRAAGADFFAGFAASGSIVYAQVSDAWCCGSLV